MSRLLASLSLLSLAFAAVLPPSSNTTSLAPSNTTSLAPSNTTSLLPRSNSQPNFECEPSYFDPSNFAASGAGEWYVKWMRSVDKDSDEWKYRHSEVDYFGYYWLGTNDFRCGVLPPHGPGCTGIPTCAHVVEHNGGMADVARKALFIAHSWHNANFLAGKVRRISEFIELNTREILEDLWQDFWAKGKPVWWEQWNTQCRYLHGIAKYLKIQIHQTLMAVIPPFGPEDGNKITWASQLDAAVSRAPFLWRIENGTGFFWPSRTTPTNSQVSTYFLSHEPYGGNIDLGVRVEGACVFSTQNYEHPERPKEFVGWYFNQYRDWIDRMDDLNYGVGFGLNGAFEKGKSSFMAEQFRFGHFAKLSPYEESLFTLKNRPTLVRDTWNHIKMGLITMMHSAQGCYLHCTPNPGQAPWLPPQNCFNDVYQTRFCPNEHTVCQAQCWHDRGDFATPVPLYGRDLLARPNRYGIDLDEYLHASYNHYLKYHHAEGPQWRPLDDGSGEDRYLGAALPTCYTNYTRLVSTTIKHRHARGVQQGNRLPCTCGDLYGNETRTFFLNNGFSLNSEPTGFGDRCSRNMDVSKTPVLSVFLTMCELGYRWPTKDLPGNKFQIRHERDEHCDMVQDFIRRYQAFGVPARASWPAKKVTDPFEIGCRMCWESSVGRDIAIMQQPVVYKVTEFREMSWNFLNGCKALDRGVCRDLGVLMPEKMDDNPLPADWPIIDPLGGRGWEY